MPVKVTPLSAKGKGAVACLSRNDANETMKSMKDMKMRRVFSGRWWRGPFRFNAFAHSQCLHALHVLHGENQLHRLASLRLYARNQHPSTQTAWTRMFERECMGVSWFEKNVHFPSHAPSVKSRNSANGRSEIISLALFPVSCGAGNSG